MSREISCVNCNKHVGIIRDAKLMKGLAFLCTDCQEELGFLIPPRRPEAHNTNDPMSMFKDIFGMKF